MAAGLAAIVVWPLYSTLRWDAAMALETDPRTAAVEWMERNAPPGTVVAIQSVHGKTSLNAPIMTDLKLEKIAQDIPRGRRFEPVRERVLAALQTRAVYEEVPFVYDFDALVSAGVRYILISDENWPEVELGISPPDSPEMLFKQALNARAVLVGCFGRSGGLLSDVPRDMIYPVIPPTIYIYQTDRAIPSDDATQVAHCGAS
jgi:hypothetical protein